jgi:hypothetical protein
MSTVTSPWFRIFATRPLVTRTTITVLMINISTWTLPHQVSHTCIGRQFLQEEIIHPMNTIGTTLGGCSYEYYTENAENKILTHTNGIRILSPLRLITSVNNNSILIIAFRLLFLNCILSILKNKS